MTLRSFALLFAIALAAPIAAAPGSVQDFQLPTPTPTATNTPQVQGPVDTEAGVPIRPRVIPTATPTNAPTATAPSPEATPVATNAAPANAAQQPPQAQLQRPRSQQTSRPTAQSVTPLGDAAPESATPPAGADTSPVDGLDFTPDLSSETAPTTLPSDSANQSADSPFNYIWWIAALAAAIAMLAGVYFYRQRNTPIAAGVANIEPPLARRQPSEEPKPEEQAQPAAPTASAPSAVLPPLPIQMKAQALSLSRSMMNATLSYRLELTNLGTHPLKEISVRADVVTAHGRAPVNEQLANSDSDLDFVSLIADIKPRDSYDLKGEFRLPVGNIRTITQGRAHLFVPLLRVRIDAEGKEPLIKTFVIGMKPQAGRGKLHPFRLDEMAQTYREIGLRALG